MRTNNKSFSTANESSMAQVRLSRTWDIMREMVDIPVRMMVILQQSSLILVVSDQFVKIGDADELFARTGSGKYKTFCPPKRTPKETPKGFFYPIF